MTHNLDYTALIEPITQADIQVYKKNRNAKGEQHDVDAIFGVVFLVGVIALSLLGGAIVGVVQGNRSGLVVGAVAIMLIVALAYVMRLHIQRSIERHAKVYKFALRNNIRFHCAMKDPNYPGVIFNEGRSREISIALGFPGGIELGNYSYVTGYGRYQETHDWSYARTVLTRRLPHIVLDSKENNSWNEAGLSNLFDRSQTLALEGDFNNHFTLYAPKQYERDALYVLTPDVMATMVEYGRNYDIEIIDDELFIYDNKHFLIDQPDFYQSVLTIIDKISSELLQQTDYYADERVGNRSLNSIAGHGRRLQYYFPWQMVMAIIIAMIVFLIGCLYFVKNL